MRKVKKIKKIPKYFDGTQSIAAIKDPIKTKANESGNAALSAPFKQPDALTKHNAQQMSNALNKNYGAQSMPSFHGISALNTGAGVAAAASQPIATALGIEQGQAAQIASGLGKAVGLINPVAGLAIEAAAPFLGGAGHNDYSKITTTNNATTATTEKSGAIGLLLGNNTDDLHRKASTYQNSLMAAEQTANKQLEWANDPRNQGMVSTLKEGGIVPGEHYASRNEVEVDANGNNAVRYKWDPKGKDTYRIMFNPDGSLTEGNMIFNDEGVRRPDGTKYSDTADKMIKNIKDPKLRKISLKKLAAEQEEQKAKEGKTKNGIPAHEKGGIQWNDLAYQTAAMLTPLLDKEKAETTRLQRPTWKAAPVAVDVLNQLQDVQLGYTLANYNTAQGGYTAGQQLAARVTAASNLAKQRAAIHQWQTEQQNKNIAQNIASYNNYANVIADIANKETDMNAANRATARNINRQNKAAALKTWGQINNDQNKRKMDKLRIAAAAPMFEYGMENYDEMVKMLTEMGLWQ